MLTLVLVGGAAISAWAVREHGSRLTRFPLAVAVAIPTLLVAYVGIGLVRQSLGG